ncbi:MAG: NAD-dependent deacylase [Muribaculaceae bacterium]|nr:NAD-dependent deacylase [Muribaculaceae bacterium]
MKKKLVISTGAGISAESGISTFRDADGLWENYDVMEVCSADGFARNPALVHNFYNDRRAQLATVQPNDAHRGLVELEKDFDVYIITQNVDDLHERAGSANTLHLHGELMTLRAIDDESKVYRLTDASFRSTPDTVIDGHRVRPDIVFFQEAVPMMEPAAQLASEADIFVVIGTTLQVYPAAALIRYVRPGIPVFYIDPNPAAVPSNVTVIPMKATAGVARLATLLQQYK